MGLFLRKNRLKIFCVGANKTGTTSIGEFLKNAGFSLAPQIPAEQLIENWYRRDFREIGRFCKKYDAFQDIPFSLDYTYQYLDQAFPNSKFILSVRSSPEEWLNSYRRFTKKLLGEKTEINRGTLSELDYNYKGFFLRSLDLIYGETTPPFDEGQYISNYLNHNNSIEAYFRGRPEKLLRLDLTDLNSSRKLCSFLNIADDLEIPHLNSSKP